MGCGSGGGGAELARRHKKPRGPQTSLVKQSANVHCIIVVINCGLLRNNLVKLVKHMFCLFLLPFW